MPRFTFTAYSRSVSVPIKSGISANARVNRTRLALGTYGGLGTTAAIIARPSASSETAVFGFIVMAFGSTDLSVSIPNTQPTSTTRPIATDA